MSAVRKGSTQGMSKPTPGPWSVESTVHGWRVWGQDTSPEAEHGDMVAVASELTEGDARLCAAAPELFRACEMAFSWQFGGEYERADVLRTLGAALAKARGKP